VSNILLGVIELNEVVLAWPNPIQPNPRKFQKYDPNPTQPNPTHGWTQPTSMSGLA